jgi:diketogulonate reductase-like aldo/keto reductase
LAVLINRRELLALGLAGCAGTLRTRPLLHASLVGMGTYTLGEDPARRADELLALRTGLDLGLRQIDTAEMYGDGKTELLVGEAIRGRRAQAFVCSKVHPDHGDSAGVARACDESLKRLGIAQLDLYLLHLRPTRFPLAETMRALEELVLRGKVRAIGVSNFETVELLDEARRALRRVPLACNQVKDALAARAIETTLAPYCVQHGIGLVGYTPFSGFPTEGAGLELLTRIGTAHGVSAHAVALAFLARTGIHQIPRADTVQHVRDNATAQALRLSADELGALTARF